MRQTNRAFLSSSSNFSIIFRRCRFFISLFAAACTVLPASAQRQPPPPPPQVRTPPPSGRAKDSGFFQDTFSSGIRPYPPADNRSFPPEHQTRPDFPPPEPPPYIPYRGRRILPEENSLNIEKISVKTMKQNKADIVFIITFNMPVNPFSLTGSAVAVNGISLNGIASFKYNMYGNEVQISVPKHLIEKENKTYTVAILKCDSYNGSSLASTYISALEYDTTFYMQPHSYEE